MISEQGGMRSQDRRDATESQRDGQSNRSSMSFTERIYRQQQAREVDMQRARDADMQRARERIPALQNFLRKAQDTQRALQGRGIDQVSDDEVHALIREIDMPKEFLKFNSDIFRNKYNTKDNEIDRKYHKAKAAWYQYTKPGLKHTIMGGIRARAYFSAGSHPYSTDLANKYFDEQENTTGQRINPNEHMLGVLTDPKFKTFIKKEVIETAGAFLGLANDRLRESLEEPQTSDLIARGVRDIRRMREGAVLLQENSRRVVESGRQREQEFYREVQTSTEP